jgi:hypothetical protein
VLLVPLALLFVKNPIRQMDDIFSTKAFKRFDFRLLVPLVFGLVAFFGVRALVEVNNDYSFRGAIFEWAYEKPLLTYLHAWFITFGPFIIVALYGWRRAVSFLREHQYLLVYFVLGAVLAWVGGQDTERFLLWLLPVVYVLIGNEIEGSPALFKSPLLLGVLVLGHVFSQRVLWPIPDHIPDMPHAIPILAPFGKKVPYLDLLSFPRVARKVNAYSLMEYLGLSAVLLLWLKYRSQTLAPE